VPPSRGDGPATGSRSECERGGPPGRLRPVFASHLPDPICPGGLGASPTAERRLRQALCSAGVQETLRPLPWAAESSLATALRVPLAHPFSPLTATLRDKPDRRMLQAGSPQSAGVASRVSGLRQSAPVVPPPRRWNEGFPREASRTRGISLRLSGAHELWSNAVKTTPIISRPPRILHRR